MVFPDSKVPNPVFLRWSPSDLSFGKVKPDFRSVKLKHKYEYACRELRRKLSQFEISSPES